MFIARKILGNFWEIQVIYVLETSECSLEDPDIGPGFGSCWVPCHKDVVTEMSNQNKFEHFHALSQVAEIRNLHNAFMPSNKASEI